jgi:flagellar hook protein FlgE
MLQAMFAGVSGLKAHQTRMNIIGNNIANVNTTGYKAARISFQDQLSQTLASATAPTGSLGGVNAIQTGLGVTLGSVDSLQTQGNLQITGKATDMAIQGNGLFAVTDGRGMFYLRDGSFDIDAEGNLTHTGTGLRLIAYRADEAGRIDLSAPITTESTLKVPLGASLAARPTSNITLSGNLNTATHNFSTFVNFSGNLSATATSGTVTNTSTVYDAKGQPHTLQVMFLNPEDYTGSGNLAAATRRWDVQISVDGEMVYDSTASDAKFYHLTGVGWRFADEAGDGTVLPPLDITVPGSQGLEPFKVRLNTGPITNLISSSNLAGVADGAATSTPNWGNSVRVFDGLGNPHTVSFKYLHVPLGTTPAPPSGATAQWEWTAVDEAGNQIGSSRDPGNSPLYFDSSGNQLGQFGQDLRLNLNPNNGAISPLYIRVATTGLTQIAGDSTASAAQDGYPTGTLQSFSIAQDGVISGIFSSGQSRRLGQVALATFANPAGLDRLGNNLLQESNNSGIPQIGVPTQGGRGKISSGFVEMSNVDLSTEFTNLIITERGFQANTRIISVVDSLLQDVINLKR